MNDQDSKCAYDWTSLGRFSFTPSDGERSKRPNVFEIAGFPRRETVSSNLLAYFFDPLQSHGLAGLFVKSLIAVLNDKRDEELARYSYSEDDNDGVYVQTEVSNGTDTRNRVDIAVHTPHLSIAIENKVDASLYNDLHDYYEKIHSEASEQGNVEDLTCVVVLHAGDLQLSDFPWCAKGLQANENLFSVNYDELFDQVLNGVGEKLLDADPRAVDLLEQYMDNFSARRNGQDMNKSDQQIRQFADQVKGHEEVAYNFLNSLGDYRIGANDKLADAQTILQSLYEVPQETGHEVGPLGLVSCGNPRFWDTFERKGSYENRVHWMSRYYIQDFSRAGAAFGVSFEFFTPIDWLIKGEFHEDVALHLMVKSYKTGMNQWKEENRLTRNPFEQVLGGVTLLDSPDTLAKALKTRCDEILAEAWSDSTV
ncbi:PD-(D/E)XK nuclease family protein [Bifidobacterium sp.]|uniref:PD-(D/E)XK nuclease family protein n=1 Tax=Bifidobacterium sp. TaxID=41200 RepID=UPI0025B9CAF2|nr:PD-(D/E)XK nuclease family protein [Bifidobacterium sp.]MCI1636105.1 PD-(D/E)XK nuclease family protein [Bifidobacterium sp.]